MRRKPSMARRKARGRYSAYVEYLKAYERAMSAFWTAVEASPYDYVTVPLPHWSN